jgi:hypothetical protein
MGLLFLMFSLYWLDRMIRGISSGWGTGNGIGTGQIWFISVNETTIIIDRRRRNFFSIYTWWLLFSNQLLSFLSLPNILWTSDIALFYIWTCSRLQLSFWFKVICCISRIRKACCRFVNRLLMGLSNHFWFFINILKNHIKFFSHLIHFKVIFFLN